MPHRIVPSPYRASCSMLLCAILVCCAGAVVAPVLADPGAGQAAEFQRLAGSGARADRDRANSEERAVHDDDPEADDRVRSDGDATSREKDRSPDANRARDRDEDEDDADRASARRKKKSASEKENASSDSEAGESGKSDGADPAAGDSTTTAPAKGPTPQVELFVPSIARLAEAASRSHAGTLYRAVSGAIEKPRGDDPDGFDINAGLRLLEEIAGWPDTSLAAAVYTADADGRPRWAVRVDWPLQKSVDRLQALLDRDEARRVLKGLGLRRSGERYVLELADSRLAMLTAVEDGTLIASAEGVELPARMFGRRAGRSAASSRTLVSCRLNLAAGDDEQASPLASAMTGVRDVRYQASLDDGRRWNERLSVGWNPLIGLSIKSVVKRCTRVFSVPGESIAVASIHLDLGGGMLDSLAELPADTTVRQAHGEFAVAVVPGAGFLPIPDVYFQFVLKNRKKALDAIREHIREDTETREEDDLPPRWREIEVGGRPAFWIDTAADGLYGLSLIAVRTVVFFESIEVGEGKSEDRLIIAKTTHFAEDAVRRWQKLTSGKTVRIPDSKEAHWQGRIRWEEVYKLAEPWLGLVTAFGEDTQPLPSAASLGEALCDSVIDARIEAGQLRVMHVGPVPFGAVFVPVAIAQAFSQEASPSSEAEREALAARNLRVLYHHAKLFKKDYGRWPATVAELDGYVDFDSHPQLLRLPAAKRGFIAGLAMVVTGAKEADDTREGVDDRLYEIEWSPGSWRLKLRPGELLNHETMYIDDSGEIGRVPKPDSKEKSVASR